MDCRRFLCARPLRATLCQPPPCLPKARRTVTDQTGSSGRTTNTPLAGHRDTHTIRNPWAATKQPQQLLAADSRPVGSTFERQHIVIVLHVHRGECATTKTVTTNEHSRGQGRTPAPRKKKIPKNSCTVNKDKKPCCFALAKNQKKTAPCRVSSSSGKHKNTKHANIAAFSLSILHVVIVQAKVRENPIDILKYTTHDTHTPCCAIPL